MKTKTKQKRNRKKKKQWFFINPPGADPKAPPPGDRRVTPVKYYHPPFGGKGGMFIIKLGSSLRGTERTDLRYRWNQRFNSEDKELYDNN